MKKNIPDTRYQIPDTKVGFTLIEILVAIAIVAILAAVVMVSMTASRNKARSAKALAQASSTISSMVSCAGNKGWSNINNPSDNGNICGSDSNYGTWPDMSQISYTYNPIVGSSANSFYFTVDGDSLTICCNSTMNSCGIPSGSCSSSATW